MGKKVHTAKSDRKPQVAVVPAAVKPVIQTASTPGSHCDLEGEEDLPSPFLTRAEREWACVDDGKEWPSPFLKQVVR